MLIWNSSKIGAVLGLIIGLVVGVGLFMIAGIFADETTRFLNFLLGYKEKTNDNEINLRKSLLWKIYFWIFRTFAFIWILGTITFLFIHLLS